MTTTPVPQGHSFIVELRGLAQNADEGYVGITSGVYRDGVAQDGWLVLRTDGVGSKTCRFHFDFVHERDGHAHYAVFGKLGGNTQVEEHEGRLEISRNGYLGLYQNSTSYQRWRLAFAEPLGDDWHAVKLTSVEGDTVRALREARSAFAPNGKETLLNTQQGSGLRLAARVTHRYP
ncbi:hypothetical protein [Pseudomonas fontis]|uniref:Uncharacterized protein n=1 Tax=Pseudomonas fontis TaxID=2942633 RepID=A0ABT5NNT7_9PSED|nr:hypothetical protein [Pseudomonas fontis]MDD0973077.1 hypothetical protein [Pseudomonas fontis]MDD0989846.1 hypothetical protein [Pseudomonas fontis]